MLSGGGARAAYQVGVLRYIGRQRPERTFPIITGVSAGAINAAYLAAHVGNLADSTESLGEHWRGLTTEDVFQADPLTILRITLRWIYAMASGRSRIGPRGRSLVHTRPLRTFLEGAMDLRGIDENLEAGRLREVAITATSYQTGQTVTFVHGEPGTSLWHRPQRLAVRDRISIDHVMASSALPLVFPAIQVHDGYYGDGSIRQAAPLAPAVHLGADRILSISARYGRSVEEAAVPSVDEYPPPAQVMGLLFNNIFLDALDADATRLERINRLLEACDGDAERLSDLRKVDLLLLRPSEDLGALAARFRSELPRFLRFLISGLEGESRSSDFVSYLLFAERYLTYLMELGEKDAEAQWPRIMEFLGWDEEDGAAGGDAGEAQTEASVRPRT